MTTIRKFEAKVRSCERIVVMVTEKSGRDKRGDAKVQADYPFERAAPEDWTLTDLERNRLARSLPGYSFRFFDLAGRELRGNTLLKNARVAKHA